MSIIKCPKCGEKYDSICSLHTCKKEEPLNIEEEPLNIEAYKQYSRERKNNINKFVEKKDNSVRMALWFTFLCGLFCILYFQSISGFFVGILFGWGLSFIGEMWHMGREENNK